MAAQTMHDPFPTDVYYLGNLIREVFLEVNLLNPHMSEHSLIVWVRNTRDLTL